MTQEEKQILLQDLSARLPYGVKATTTSNGWNGIYTITGYKDDRIYLDCPVYDEGDDEWLVESVKPYLRSLSSMTEKEKEKLRDKNIFIAISTSGTVETTIDGFDWLNKNMFDYRGLIPMGLALEAPEGMYNIMEGTFKEYADWMRNIGCATCIYVERLFSLLETKDTSKKFKFEFKCTHKNRIVTADDGQIGRRCRGFIE